MTLYEKSDGILETYVTWEDIETNLQRSFNTNATFGENKKATNISDMKGYMSRIALIDPDWQNVEEGKKLPEKFAVKICSQIPLLALSKMMKYEGENGFSNEKMDRLSVLTRHCHNREVGAYRLLQKFNHPDIPYTKIFGLKPFEGNTDLKGYIIADFIPNLHNFGTLKSIGPQNLEPAVRGIATFAALTESVPAEEKSFAGGPEYLDIFFEQFLDDVSLGRMMDGLKLALGDEHKEKTNQLVETFLHYKKISKKYQDITALLGLKMVMVHGDMWKANMLYTMDDQGAIKLEAIIDWQALSTVPPGLDLARLFLGCLTNQERREKGPELLKLYHQTYTDVRGKEDFTFQQLQDSYNLYVPVMAMLILPSLLPFVNGSNIPEAEKEQLRKETLTRMVGMMEEILETHDSNLRRFPDFLKL